MPDVVRLPLGLGWTGAQLTRPCLLLPSSRSSARQVSHCGWHLSVRVGPVRRSPSSLQIPACPIGSTAVLPSSAPSPAMLALRRVPIVWRPIFMPPWLRSGLLDASQRSRLLFSGTRCSHKSPQTRATPRQRLALMARHLLGRSTASDRPSAPFDSRASGSAESSAANDWLPGRCANTTFARCRQAARSKIGLRINFEPGRMLRSSFASSFRQPSGRRRSGRQPARDAEGRSRSATSNANGT